ncbi:MAG: glycine dehydrogenase (aminomethyl-transferring), partial [Alphaproteobacteria bacterium]
MSAAELTALEAQYAFDRRHIGPSEAEISEMLRVVGAGSLTELAARTVPAAILEADLSALPPAVSEAEAIAELRALAEQNRADIKSLIGLGYHGTLTPPVIL